jgi:hypothetical protein
MYANCDEWVVTHINLRKNLNYTIQFTLTTYKNLQTYPPLKCNRFADRNSNGATLCWNFPGIALFTSTFYQEREFLKLI